MHKSIFDQVKDYSSDPLTEFGKLSQFIENKNCYFSYGSSRSIYDLFSVCFESCRSLRSVFQDLSDCISLTTPTIAKYSNFYYNTVPVEDRESIFDEFLSYCETLGCMYRVSMKRCVSSHIDTINNEALSQFYEMLQTSLKSMNYELIPLDDDEKVEVKKIDPGAEHTASISEPTIKNVIIKYLGIRDRDLPGKVTTVHCFVDLLEPTLKKYQTDSMVGKIKMFLQVIRHPEIKKAEKGWEWYFQNEANYIDDVFEMCIFVQNYRLTKDIISNFTKQSNQN